MPASSRTPLAQSRPISARAEKPRLVPSRILKIFASLLIGLTATSCTNNMQGPEIPPSRHGDRVAQAGKLLKGKVGIVVVEMGEKPRLHRPGTSDDAYSIVASGFTSAAGEVACDPSGYSCPVSDTNFDRSHRCRQRGQAAGSPAGRSP